MAIVHNVIGKTTPPASDARRAEATAKAGAVTTTGDWLSLVLNHHEEIRARFSACKQARAAADRKSAMQDLALVLNGHSLAEEVVLYPALAQAGKIAQAGLAYTEQTTAKMQMAELEDIAASSEAWLDKLEHIEGAVLHPMFEEESSWFLDLKEAGEHQDRMTTRYQEEFERSAAKS